MSARDKLIAFEKRVDVTVEGLGVLRVPLNVVLTSAFLMIDRLFHGSRGDMEMSPRPAAGYSATSRLSYLLPLLLRCPATPVGSSVANAMLALDKANFEELLLLIQYGHFCEIMPEVHRGLYNVLGGGTQFTLQHTNQAVADGEARDVVLTEMAMPFYVQPAASGDHFDELARALPTCDLGTLASTVTLFYEHYMNHSYELPILSDAAFVSATGATYEEFVRFRSAWAAVADFALGMADAVARRLRAASASGEKEALGNELFEWLAVRLNSNFLGGLVIAVTRLAPSIFGTLMRFFAIDATKAAARQGGDGFFPPIVSYSDSYQFNPDVLRVMLSARNVPYGLNRIDRSKFDNLVSSDLEPQLLKSAEPIFRKIAGIEVTKNHVWGNGEIDLLAYQAASNMALHVQAKAALPPQGARMVDRVEGRSREGLRQIAAFRALPQQRIDEVISAALGRQVRDVRVADVLLCRSSVGTYKIWAELGDVVAVNVPLLYAAVERMKSEGRSLAEFGGTVNELVAALCTDSIRGWQPTPLVLADTTITVPILDLDHAALDKYRMQWHPR